jgi:hypothetical protein
MGGVGEGGRGGGGERGGGRGEGDEGERGMKGREGGEGGGGGEEGEGGEAGEGGLFCIVLQIKNKHGNKNAEHTKPQSAKCNPDVCIRMYYALTRMV